MAGPFIERYRAIVEPLFGRAFTGADGFSVSDSDMRHIGYELPDALRDFYDVLGRFDPVMCAHNRFYLPNEFTRLDDKLVFCEENQNVVLWGYHEDQGWTDDPPIYQGVNNDEVEWYVENHRSSDFLCGMIYWQALNGGLPAIEFRSTASEAIWQAVSAWPLVIQEEDCQLYSRGSVVFKITRDTFGTEVMASGSSEAELSELWSLLGLPLE